MGKTISFRLRKIDSDLEKAISGIKSDELADLCRDGLRYMLGITTTRTMQLVEKTIKPPQSIKATIGTSPPPTPYKPKS